MRYDRVLPVLAVAGLIAVAACGREDDTWGEPGLETTPPATTTDPYATPGTTTDPYGTTTDPYGATPGTAPGTTTDPVLEDTLPTR
jgi:hypothetical protein